MHTCIHTYTSIHVYIRTCVCQKSRRCLWRDANRRYEHTLYSYIHACIHCAHARVFVKSVVAVRGLMTTDATNTHCIHRNMHTCIHTYIYIYTYIHAYMRTCVCQKRRCCVRLACQIHKARYILLHIHMYIYTCMYSERLCICIYYIVSVCVYIFTCIFTHANIQNTKAQYTRVLKA